MATKLVDDAMDGIDSDDHSQMEKAIEHVNESHALSMAVKTASRWRTRLKQAANASGAAAAAGGGSTSSNKVPQQIKRTNVAAGKSGKVGGSTPGKKAADRVGKAQASSDPNDPNRWGEAVQLALTNDDAAHLRSLAARSKIARAFVIGGCKVQPGGKFGKRRLLPTSMAKVAGAAGSTAMPLDDWKVVMVVAVGGVKGKGKEVGGAGGGRRRGQDEGSSSERTLAFKCEVGDSLLHLAAKNNQPMCCRALLQLGAKSTAVNGVGRTAIACCEIDDSKSSDVSRYNTCAVEFRRFGPPVDGKSSNSKSSNISNSNISRAGATTTAPGRLPTAKAAAEAAVVDPTAQIEKLRVALERNHRLLGVLLERMGASNIDELLTKRLAPNPVVVEALLKEVQGMEQAQKRGGNKVELTEVEAQKMEESLLNRMMRIKGESWSDRYPVEMIVSPSPHPHPHHHPFSPGFTCFHPFSPPPAPQVTISKQPATCWTLRSRRRAMI
jgi:hypothetical protein